MRCHPRLPTEDPAHERRKNPGKKNLRSNSADRRKVHVVDKQYKCNFLRARNRSFEGKPSFLIPWPHLVGMLEVRCWFRDSRQFNFVFLTFPKSIGRITTKSSCTNGQWSQSSESSAAVHHSEATSFNKTKSGLTPQTGTLPQHVGLIAKSFFSQTKNHPACTNGATFPSIYTISFFLILGLNHWHKTMTPQLLTILLARCLVFIMLLCQNLENLEQKQWQVRAVDSISRLSTSGWDLSSSNISCKSQLNESKKSKKHTEATHTTCARKLNNLWTTSKLGRLANSKGPRTTISAKAINCMELQIFIFKVHNQKSRSSGGKAANLVPHQSVWILSSYRNRAAGSLSSLNTELQSIAALTSR